MLWNPIIYYTHFNLIHNQQDFLVIILIGCQWGGI